MAGGWWARAYPWIPAVDERGHPLGPGAVNLSFIACLGCPATTDERGHPVARCRVIGCDAPPIFPPGHVGEVPRQR